MIRCVVFDFDGTLVDSNGLKRGVFLEVASAHPGGEREMAAVIAEVQGDRSSIFSNYADRMAARGFRLDPRALTREFSHRVDPLVVTAPEIPGATELLRALKALEIRLHLNSATPEDSLCAIVAGRGWTHRFDGIHGHPKSKDENLRVILEREGITPAAVAMVGDGLDDEAAATALGCAFVPVGSGSYARARPGAKTHALASVPERIGLNVSSGVGR